MATYTYTQCRDVIRPIYGPTVQISDRSKSAVRKSFVSPVLPTGVYEIRVKRVLADSPSEYVQDTVVLTDVNEIILDDVRYRNTALVGLKIQLTDQLNGIPKLTYINHGRNIRVWNGTTFVYENSANPAWVTLDILTNLRYGGRIPDSRIDMEKWKEWAAYCDLKGLKFNGVIEAETNVWDAMQYVFRAGHAQIVNMGTRYTVTIEKADVPVQMFSVGNMVKGTFKQNWLPVSERANEIEVSYFDKDDNYRRNTVKVYDPVAISTGAPLRSANITLVGIDNKTQAHKEAVFQLNLNKYILQTVEFSAPIEAIAASVGDLIYVQHDMPQWGFGGRLDAGNTTSVLKLDRPVPMVPGTTYKALVFFDAVQRQSGTITSITGNSVLLAGFSGGTNVKRLKSGAIDKKIEYVYGSPGNYGVVVEDTTGLVAGQPYVLWDTSVIEERDVVNSALTSTEVSDLVVTIPFSATPDQFTNWMYGPVNKVKKPFRIRSVGGSHEYHRDIVALEYNESVYDLDTIPVPTVNFSNLDTTVSHATISGVTETLVFVSSILRSEVTVHFTSAQENYRNSKVYVSRNGGEFEYLGMFFNRASVEADAADELVFKVVATDMVGVSAAETTAPTSSYTVLGKTAPPANVTGLAFEHLETGTKFTWTAVADLDLSHYEVRRGADWASGVKVYEGPDNQFVEPLMSAGAYNFHIKAVDTSGNESSAATSIAVTVSAPAAVSPTGILAGENYSIVWSEVSGSYPARQYIVKRGGSWIGGTVLANHDSTRFSARADWNGTQQFWVAAVDVAGNEGTPASVNLVVNAPSAPTVSTAFSGENVVVSWTTPSASLNIKEYEVRYGSTFGTGISVGRVQGDRVMLKVDWIGSRTFWVAAVDSANNVGASASAVATVTALGAPSVTQTIIALKAQLDWTVPTTGSLPVVEYEIRHGASFAAGTLITRTTSQSFRVPIDWVGSRSFWIAAIDTAGNVGTAGTTSVNISVPSSPTVSASLLGTDFRISWVPGTSTLPIEEYEVRYGVSYAAGTLVGRVKGTTLSGVVNWGGNRTFWVAAYDQNGNISTASSVSLNITVPATPSVSFQVVDNNVLLQWTDSVTSLPISSYEVRKGAVFSTATIIGTVGGRFTTVFETASGTYTYWIVAIDSAGNRSVEASTSATVANPPDYILFDQFSSQLDSASAVKTIKTSNDYWRLNLDGSTQYGSIASLTDLDSGITGLTMEAWALIDSTQTNHGIVEKTIGGNVNTCALIFVSWPSVHARVVIGSTLYTASYGLPAQFDKQFVHLALRWDSANGVNIVVNGVVQATTAAAGSLDQGAGALKVGQLGTGATGYSLKGALGPVRIYKRRVTDTELLEHYRDIYKNNASLVAAWGVDEGAGITLQDDFDNSNDIVLVGAPVWQRDKLDGRRDPTESKALLYPVDSTRTFAEHFTDASATTHQNLITAGNTHGLTPAPNSASYVEVIDYGTVIPSTKITVTANHENLVGTVTVTPKISIKENWADPWTDFTNVYSVFATSFRYVKVTLDFSSAGGNHVGRMLEVSVTLDVKLINDAGTVNCAAGDTGGTTVTFNVPFVDVNSITVTPAGTTPVIPVYDFVDVPNPTTFKVLLFDRATGARVSGLASWAAKGV